MTKHITIKEPANLDAYLEGYKSGYDMGNYDCLESFYVLIKEQGDQAAAHTILNQLKHQFGQGDTDANSNH